MNMAPDHQAFAGLALERMARVADDIAARHAADVDRVGRFPAETFAALKAERLLGVAVPRELAAKGLISLPSQIFAPSWAGVRIVGDDLRHAPDQAVESDPALRR